MSKECLVVGHTPVSYKLPMVSYYCGTTHYRYLYWSLIQYQVPYSVHQVNNKTKIGAGPEHLCNILATCFRILEIYKSVVCCHCVHWMERCYHTACFRSRNLQKASLHVVSFPQILKNSHEKMFFEQTLHHVLLWSLEAS